VINRSKAALPVITLILMTGLFLLAGCSDNQANKDINNSKTLDVIKVANSSIPTSVSLADVADELGFMAEEGIKLEFVGIVPAGQLVASVTSEKLDVGGAHVNRTIAGIAAGAKIKAVIANTETTEERPHMTYVVREDGPIKSAKDMVGKKLAIYAYGGCNEYTPYEYLRKNGISDPKGKFQIVIVPAGKEEEALRRGEVDIAGIHDSPENILKHGGGVRVLFTDYDVWGTVGGATPSYFSENFIKEKPDVVRRYVKAMAKTINWVNANPEQAAEISARRLKVDPGIVRANYYAPDGIIKEDSVQVWIDLLKDYGEITKDIKLEDVYTNEFNPNFKK